MNALVQSFQGAGSFRVVTLSAVAVILLATFAFLSLRLASPVLSPMYSNLSPEDGGEIIAELDGMGIPYQVAGNGSQILVPTGEVQRLRLLLAQQGLPSNGSIVGYEIFDKSDAMGTSNFVHNVNFIRALEGELARTISSMDSVSSARVHLVVPKRQIFNRNRADPTASVILTLKGRRTPTSEKIAAIRHLVATAVPGLELTNITIVDSTGNLLARGGGSADDPGIAAASTQEMRAGFEKKLKRTLEELLEQSVGLGRVQAEVSAEMEFDRIVTNSEQYDPDGRVARSIQTTEERQTSTEAAGGGDVSVANNLPEALPGDGGGGGNSSTTERTDETQNFEISRTVTNHVKDVGIVKRLTVAVLVDGTYEVADEETGEREYKPRTDEEIEQIRKLVESAIGYDEERGDSINIVNMPFNRNIEDLMQEEGPFDWLKRDLNSILKTLIIGVVAILAILLVIRPLVNRAFEVSPAELEAGGGGGAPAYAGGDMAMGMGMAEGGEEGEEGINVDEIQSRVNTSSVKKVNEIVETNPEETLTVIRSWLSQK